MTRGHYVRIQLLAPLTVPLDEGRIYEPPACNVLTAGGFCHRDEGHRGGHLPIPLSYPPQDVNQ